MLAVDMTDGFWRKPDWPRAAALCAVFVVNGLTNIHFLLFGGLGVALAVVFLAIAEPRLDWRMWLRLLAALALGALRRFRQFAGWEQRMTEVRDWLRSIAEQGT